MKNNWGGGPRGTPTVDGNRIYAMSGKGDLICTDLAGKIQWQASMARLGGKTPGWGYTESILIDGNLALATPGGRQGAVAAFNKLTGKVVWQSKQFTDGAQYASIIAATPAALSVAPVPAWVVSKCAPIITTSSARSVPGMSASKLNAFSWSVAAVSG